MGGIKGTYTTLVGDGESTEFKFHHGLGTDAYVSEFKLLAEREPDRMTWRTTVADEQTYSMWFTHPLPPGGGRLILIAVEDD